MSLVPDNANSATSQWFINLADNGGPPNNLDIQTKNSQNVTFGPYTVFGRVVGNGMDVADDISRPAAVNAGAPFSELPLRNYSGGSIKIQHLVSIPTITHIAPLKATSDNGNVTVAVSDSKLLVTPNTSALRTSP